MRVSEARQSFEKGAFDTAIALGMSAFNEASKLENKDIKGECSLLIGKAYRETKRYQSAMVYLFTALYIFDKDDNKKKEAFLQIGILYYQIGVFNKSLDYFHQAELLEAKNKQIPSFELHRNMADCYLKLRNLPNAILQLNISIEKPSCSIIQRIDVLKTKSNAYLEHKDYKNAYETDLELLSLANQYPRQINKSDIWNSIGYIFHLQQNDEEALKAFQESAKIGRQNNSRDSLYLTLINIGSIYSKLKNPDSSLAKFNEAFELISSDPDRSKEALIRNYLSTSYLALTNHSKAIEHNNLAIRLSEQNKNRRILSDAYFIRSKICEAQGNESCKKQYWEKYRSIEDSIALVNFVSSQQTLKFNTEIKQKEEEVRQLILSNEIEILNNLRKEDSRKKELQDQEMKLKIFEVELRNETLKKENALNELDKNIREFKIQKLVQIQKEQQHSNDIAKSRLALVNSQLVLSESENEQKALLMEKKELELKRSAYLKYFMLIAFGLILIIIALFFLYYKQRLQSREQQLSLSNIDIQQRLLRSQMNPHFLFNSLSSIQGFIASNEKEKAGKFLARYASLMRIILEHTSQEVIPLEQEKTALKAYLSLEQMRFNNIFSYDIVCPDLDAEFVGIPPMLIQPYVENAVVHGLRNKKENGKLLISFHKEADYLICNITDNGIGREAALQLSKEKDRTHRSMALNLTRERIQLINEQTKSNMSVSIEDLVSTDGQALGTSVTLRINFQELV